MPKKPENKKTNRSNVTRLIVLGSSILVLLLCALIISSVINNAYDTSIPTISVPVVSVPPTPGTGDASLPVSDSAPPSQPDDATSDALPEGPPRIIYAAPENGLIDDSYFDNVTFVGDSISQGLQLYRQGIQNAHHCTYKSIGPKGIYDGSLWARPDGTKEVPMEAIVASQPDNVYILIGTNAIVSMSDEAFLAYYAEMLDAIRANLHPEVSIYIQSITPVVQGVDTRFDADRINSLNDALAQMAHDKDMVFLNLHEVLAGEDGWLIPEYGAADGYHLTPEGYGVWAQYLRTHTVNHRRHDHLYIEQ